MLSRSRPSRMPSSWIWRANASISRSMSSAPPEPYGPSWELLISDRSDDWWPMMRGRRSSGFAATESGAAICDDELRWRRWSRLRPAAASRPSSSDADSVPDPPAPEAASAARRCRRRASRAASMPAPPSAAATASCRLISRTSSTSRRSACWMRCSSAVSRGRCTLGKTLSPGRYLLSISAFSASDLRLSGCAASSISSSVTTVALCLVLRTASRQEGQVKMGVPAAGGFGRVSADWACQPNHSLRHAPQNVWRQSSRVNGW